MELKQETNAYVLIVAAVAVVAMVSLVLSGGILQGAFYNCSRRRSF